MKGILNLNRLPNGAWQNQLGSVDTVPAGWAVIPDELELPATFPFVEVMAEEVDGVLTVVAMTEGEMPEVPREPDPMPQSDMEARVSALEERSGEMAEALDLLLSGVTE